MTKPKLTEAGAATRFKPGTSGNPSGRPKEAKGLKELARAYTKDALKTLVGVMLNERSPAAARVAAANALLDRGYGKATQPIGGDADGPLNVVIRRFSVDAVSAASVREPTTNGHAVNGHNAPSEQPSSVDADDSQVVF